MFKGAGMTFIELMDSLDLSALELRSLPPPTPNQMVVITGRKTSKSPIFGMSYGRGSGKSRLYADLMDQLFKEYIEVGNGVVKPGVHDTVATALSQVTNTRMSSEVDDDPLFAAMERHNNRIKAGKAALKTLFKAEALPVYHNRSTGPAKTKDWE